jgi:hypothetical protein
VKRGGEVVRWPSLTARHRAEKLPKVAPKKAQKKWVQTGRHTTTTTKPQRGRGSRTVRGVKKGVKEMNEEDGARSREEKRAAEKRREQKRREQKRREEKRAAENRVKVDGWRDDEDDDDDDDNNNNNDDNNNNNDDDQDDKAEALLFLPLFYTQLALSPGRVFWVDDERVVKVVMGRSQWWAGRSCSPGWLPSFHFGSQTLIFFFFWMDPGFAWRVAIVRRLGSSVCGWMDG